MFSWYCECTQIKVDLLQLQMMYYSYPHDKKLWNILSYFRCYQEKVQVIVQVSVLILMLFFQSILNYWKNYEFNFVVHFFRFDNLKSKVNLKVT